MDWIEFFVCAIFIQLGLTGLYTLFQDLYAVDFTSGIMANSQINPTCVQWLVFSYNIFFKVKYIEYIKGQSRWKIMTFLWVHLVLKLGGYFFLFSKTLNNCSPNYLNIRFYIPNICTGTYLIDEFKWYKI